MNIFWQWSGSKVGLSICDRCGAGVGMVSGWCLPAILMFLMARAQFAANHHKTCVHSPAWPLISSYLEIDQFIRPNVGLDAPLPDRSSLI